MSDYSQITDFSAKDALSSGNPLKVIYGADIDAELAAISTAIASKIDDTGLVNSTNGFAALTDPGADRIPFWDDSDGGIEWLVPSTGLAISGNNLALSFLGFEALTDPGADRIAFWDDSAGAFAWLTVGSGLSITNTTLAASADSTQFKYKAADLGRQSTTTFAADDELADIALVASSVYLVEYNLIHAGNGSTSNGFKFRLNWDLTNVDVFGGSPAITMTYSGGIPTLRTSSTDGTSDTISAYSAGVTYLTTGRLVLVTQADFVDGDYDVEWAQASSVGTDTDLKEGSWIRVTKIS